MQVIEEIKDDYCLPSELENDIERYVNQGGLLGVFTYYLIYLRTGDEKLAAKAGLIPQQIFIMSSLHDDAVDNAKSRGDDLKQYLNLRITIGDLVYTKAIELIDRLPKDYEIEMILRHIRKIGFGQLYEEDNTPQISLDGAIARVEERGSVWGELAVTPVEAADYYSKKELDYLHTFMGNFLFVLTLVDDVEDIPEDYENNVVNIPLILLELEPESYSKDEVIRMFLNSDVPNQLDELLTTRQSKMESAAKDFYKESGYSKSELLNAWNKALYWYIDSICTIPLEQIVPPSKQEEVSNKLSGSNTAKREFIVDEVIDDFPARADSLEEFATRASTLPGEDLTPAVISTLHIETLVEAVMTTNLDDAIGNLKAKAQG